MGGLAAATKAISGSSSSPVLSIGGTPSTAVVGEMAMRWTVLVVGAVIGASIFMASNPDDLADREVGPNWMAFRNYLIRLVGLVVTSQ